MNLIIYWNCIDIPGNSHKNGTSDNIINHSSLDTDEDMGMFIILMLSPSICEIEWSKTAEILFDCLDVDPVPNRKSSKSGVERMLEFGRELFQMSQRLEKENGANETNRRMLEVGFNKI